MSFISTVIVDALEYLAPRVSSFVVNDVIAPSIDYLQEQYDSLWEEKKKTKHTIICNSTDKENLHK